jgi:hypothetical protein
MAGEITTLAGAFLIVFAISYMITFFVFGGSSWWDLVDPNAEPVYYGLPVSAVIGALGSYAYYTKVYG